MAETTEFKRIVLGFHSGGAERTTLDLATELADLLHLDLLGVFLADEGLFHLAGLPFAREFRVLGGGWRPLAADELDRDMAFLARSAQRLFADQARSLQTASSFSVLRGASSDSIATVSRAGDIVIIVDPGSPAERVTQPFSTLFEAALRSAASVMLVPSRLQRRGGPVVALAALPEDASIPAAMKIAAALDEDVVVVAGFEPDEAWGPRLTEMAVAAGIHAETLSARALPTDDRAIASILAGLNERLLVVGRHAVDISTPLMLASLRRVPVLVVGGGDNRGADL
jgi:hypothetical protein